MCFSYSHTWRIIQVSNWFANDFFFLATYIHEIIQGTKKNPGDKHCSTTIRGMSLGVKHLPKLLEVELPGLVNIEKAIENCHRIFVDLAMNSMVDLSIVFCKRLPYKAIFSGDIPLHRPYFSALFFGLIYGSYLQSIGSCCMAIDDRGLVITLSTSDLQPQVWVPLFPPKCDVSPKWWLVGGCSSFVGS